jgi:phosphoglycolate phosphatase-like HAD superfamily hydrolase
LSRQDEFPIFIFFMAAVDNVTKAATLEPSHYSSSPVIIWDLDETLIIFDSLRDGKFAAAHGKDEQAGRDIGNGLSRLLMALLDGIFSFRKLERVDVGSLAEPPSMFQDASAEKTGQSPPGSSTAGAEQSSAKLSNAAALITRIAEIYDGGEARLATLVPAGWLAERKRLLAEVEAYTDGWLAAASNGLSNSGDDGSAVEATSTTAEAPSGLTSRLPKPVNMVVTASHWVAALGKLLLFALSEHVRACDVFSATHRSKTAAFEAALMKHAIEQTARQPLEEASKDLPTVIAVGDGTEEATAAADLAMPFVRVRSSSDLMSIPKLQDLATGTKDALGIRPKRLKTSLIN